MAYFRSATHNITKQYGSWTSLQLCIDQFVEQFPGENIPYDTISLRKHIVLKHFADKHCLCKANRYYVNNQKYKTWLQKIEAVKVNR